MDEYGKITLQSTKEGGITANGTASSTELLGMIHALLDIVADQLDVDYNELVENFKLVEVQDEAKQTH